MDGRTYRIHRQGATRECCWKQHLGRCPTEASGLAVDTWSPCSADCPTRTADRSSGEGEQVVAFIKGSRSAPQCGFSQRVVGILEAHGVDFVTVDVLDEEHNHGLRETLKTYSNWPTFPQVFVGGELVGGCDIVSSMAEKGELSALFQK